MPPNSVRSRLPPPAFIVGLAAVVCASLPLLTPLYTVRWDAMDSWLVAFRWMGSCLRAGYFGEYFPYTFSGWSMAGQIEYGFYNVFYLVIAFLFPDSVFSINVLYLLLQVSEFCLCYRLGGQLGRGPLGRLALGLGVLASGFWVGHAEHLSYLLCALAATMVVSGILELSEGSRRIAFALLALATYLFATGGHPEIALHAGIALAFFFSFQLSAAERGRRTAMLAVAGAATLLGLAVALPAIVHFLQTVGTTYRGKGMPVDVVMRGSLPLYSLTNLLLPSWRWEKSATDISMDRFHLLHSTVPLLLLGAILAWRRQRLLRVPVILSLIGCCSMLMLSLGDNSPVPLRRLLAEQWFLFRAGRWPGAEYMFFLVLMIAAGCAWSVDRLRELGWPPKLLGAALLVDFCVVMAATATLRIHKTPPELRGRLPLFKVSYDGEERPVLQKPRLCPEGRGWMLEQWKLAPAGFCWWGYSALIADRYNDDRDAMRWALCPGPRLWDFAQRAPLKYRLIRYSPSQVSLLVSPPPGRPLLLWAEGTDGNCELTIDGVKASFEPGPAALRYFHIPPTAASPTRVDMLYLGPLTRFWRQRPAD